MASVTCSIHKGDLPIEIYWFRDNTTLDDSVDGVTILRGKKLSALSLDSVSFESAGEYTCVAKNRAGVTSFSAVLNVNGI